jgi:hypothetical protein
VQTIHTSAKLGFSPGSAWRRTSDAASARRTSAAEAARACVERRGEDADEPDAHVDEEQRLGLGSRRRSVSARGGDRDRTPTIAKARRTPARAGIVRQMEKAVEEPATDVNS